MKKLGFAAFFAVSLAFGGVASAAVPHTIALEGNLQTASGGPVSDGAYSVTFSLYKDATGGKAVWSENVAKLAVAAGTFTHALGSVQKIAGLDGASAAWLGVKIGAEPELPRSRVNAVPFALRAAVAEDVSCTGCVSVGEMKFDGNVDLGKFGISAGNAKFTNVNATNINSAAITATGVVKAASFQGDGSKLTGIQSISGNCNAAGEVVKGIDANGKLVCVKAMDPKNLPPDGLDNVSNGLLTNEFTDTFTSAAAVPIKDNWPKGVSSSIVVPDIGLVKAIRVTISLKNSNFKKMTVQLTDPAKGTFMLFNDGKVSGGVLNATYPAPNKPVSGDLTTWHGKNAKGTWTLVVTDGDFKDNKDDGEITKWSVEIDTLSNKKVAGKGAFLATGGFGFPVSDKPPFACDKANAGRAYVNDVTNQMFVCLGGTWRAVALQACGNGIVEIGETCDDGTKNSDKTADACRTTCVKPKCGDGVKDNGEQCDDGNSNDGDSCKNNCTVPCTGFLYKGVCLKSTTLTSNADKVPAGCTPYQPSKGWGKADYVAICDHFSKAKGWSVNCGAVDTDADGGLCTNYKAIMSWEGPGQSSPDVWLRSPTFNYNPVGSPSSQQCRIYNYSNNLAVYACQ